MKLHNEKKDRNPAQSASNILGTKDTFALEPLPKIEINSDSLREAVEKSSKETSKKVRFPKTRSKRQKAINGYFIKSFRTFFQSVKKIQSSFHKITSALNRANNRINRLYESQLDIDSNISQFQKRCLEKRDLFKEELKEEIAAMRDEVFELFDEIQNKAEEKYSCTLKAIEQQNKAIEQQISAIRSDFRAKEYQFNKAIELIQEIPQKEKSPAKELISLKQRTDDAHLDLFYLEFENRFRGSQEMIRERLKKYLPHLEEYLEKNTYTKPECNILDIGCGRGEWLSLLRDNGYRKLKGIDLNTIMINECEEKKLDASCQDAVEYISSLPENSVDILTGFHIIEHLSFQDLMRTFSEAHRVLKKGGLCIFETPNPENLRVGSFSFYYDPTHRNPLPAELSQFIATWSGFKQADILYSAPFSIFSYVGIELPSPPAESMLHGDYAIIAKK